MRSIDCPSPGIGSRRVQLAYRRRIDARCAPWPRRDHAADSARAPRFILAIAADFSPPVPHHDITVWWRSQRSDASRKCAAQLSLDSTAVTKRLSTGVRESTAKGWSVRAVNSEACR